MTRLKGLLKKLPPIKTSALTGFVLFGRFPIEIQNKIWFLSLTPRDIKLYVPSINPMENPQMFQPRVPPILHVSRHARAEGLRYYTACLEQPRRMYSWGCYGLELFESKTRLKVYINFKLDTFTIWCEPISTDISSKRRQQFNFAPDILDQIVRVSAADLGDLEKSGVILESKSIEVFDVRIMTLKQDLEQELSSLDFAKHFIIRLEGEKKKLKWDHLEIVNTS